MEIFLLPIFFQYFYFEKDFIKILEKKSEFSQMILFPEINFCTKNFNWSKIKNFFNFNNFFILKK